MGDQSRFFRRAANVSAPPPPPLPESRAPTPHRERLSSAEIGAISDSVDILALIEPTTSLKKIGPREWAGPCPVCGGTDRFRVNVDKGWFCRRCKSEHWHDGIDFMMWYEQLPFMDAIERLGGGRLTSAEIEYRAAERAARDRERAEAEAAAQAAARASLAERGDWERYYQALTPETRALWHKRGLSDDWIDFYKLGYNAGREFRVGKSVFNAASLTIPYWRAEIRDASQGPEWRVVGMKHRIITPNDLDIRYLPDVPGLGQQMFLADPPRRPKYDRVLLVEGEIKAMVTYAALWGEDGLMIESDILVMGLPGASPRPEILAELDGADTVYICLDPDTFIKPRQAPPDWTPPAERLAEAIGRERSRIIRMPDKIDDMITIGSLTGYGLVRLLDYERR